MKLNIGTYAFIRVENLDLLGKLKAAKELGYTGVEFLANDMENYSTDQLKEWLAESGMECVSLHASIDKIEENIPKMAELGGKMIICPSYQFDTKDEAISLAKQLEELGRKAKEYGIKIGYHNHQFEFRMYEGKPLLEYVIENSDPELVYFQLDCGWAQCGGTYPPSFIRKYRNRFVSIHVKENNKVLGPGERGGMRRTDLTPEQREAMMLEMRKRMETQCPIGDPTSNIDWVEIKKALDEQDFEAAWTEEREYAYNGDMLSCLKEDCDWLKAHIK